MKNVGIIRRTFMQAIRTATGAVALGASPAIPTRLTR